ncbi:hypothetical protein PALB_11290 [Pseudoalteromonas luteoviolacea B = ATCC 29581]|nr:hypothetical protein PALB_11290 [Pseudoalteromonas luteoviolacea B = ATCC 29581]
MPSKGFISTVLLSVLLLVFCYVAVAKDVVRYNVLRNLNDVKQDYYVALLELALKKSQPEYGDYELKEVAIELANQARTLEMLAEGDFIDVHWSMTSAERERLLGTVYVPIMKGMMGARIFITHNANRSALLNINEPNDLKQFTVGSGYAWPDTEILEFNGFDVTTGSSLQLLTMLEKQRFVLYPRAIHEPWDEVIGHGDLDIESRFGLCYPVAMYFFVNKRNELLRKRLELGLERAIDDGSLDALFKHHPVTAKVIEQSRLNERKWLPLVNPNITSRTEQLLSDKRYVWKPLQHCMIASSQAEKATEH